jgi:hypothetical protein
MGSGQRPHGGDSAARANRFTCVPGYVTASCVMALGGLLFG